MKIPEELFDKLWNAVQQLLITIQVLGQRVGTASSDVEKLSEVCDEIIKKRNGLPVAPKGRIITEGKDKVARQGDK